MRSRKNRIERIVLEKYPITESERKCAIEKREMEQLRAKLAERMLNKLKQVYHSGFEFI